MKSQRYVARAYSEPARDGGPAFFALTVVDGASARSPWGAENDQMAEGEYVVVAPRGDGVRVEFGRAWFFRSSGGRGPWFQEATRSNAAALLRAAPAPRRPTLERVSGGDPAYARRLPAALEGAVEMLAGDARVRRHLGKRATDLLMAWLERRPHP